MKIKLRKITKCIFIALFICIIVILLKDEFSPYIINNKTYGMAPLIRSGHVSNLYIGSSMFRQGLDIDILNEENKETYILAYNGNTPVMEQFELEYLISNGVIIDNLYIDMYAYTICENRNIEDEKIFLELDLIDKIELWKKAELGNSSKIESLWRMLISSNNELLIMCPLSSYVANKYFFKGGVRLVNSSTLNEETTISVPVINPIITDEQKIAINNIINISKENDINLIFIETPKYYSVTEDSGYNDLMDEYKSLLNEKNIKYITVDDYNFDVKNNICFADLMHLSSYGKELFTNQILAVFNR